MKSLNMVMNEDQVEIISLNDGLTITSEYTDHQSQYIVPSSLVALYNDVEKERSAQIVAGDTQPDIIVDVLSSLPYFLRKMVQYIISKPFMFISSKEASFTLTNGNQKIDIQGTLFTEVSFI